MTRTGIEISGLGYEVGGTEILKNVDARIPDGGITAVVGPSGAGKSTLLRAINRLIEPTSGEVYLDGEPTSGLDVLELRRRVGMVFQIPALFGGSVEQAVLYGAGLWGKDADPRRLVEAARRRIEELVTDLNARLGLTMVFVSHDLFQVERVAGRVVLMSEGRSEGEWVRDDFFSAAGERARRYIAGRL